jgi:DNA replication protein DnaC
LATVGGQFVQVAAQRAGLFFGETGTGKTTNLPLSEWNTMFPNAGPRKVMLDRLTDQVHLIETGTKSYRFRRALHRKEGG